MFFGVNVSFLVNYTRWTTAFIFSMYTIWSEGYTVVLGILVYTAGCGQPTPPSRGSIEDFQSAAEGATITYSCSPGLVPRTQMSAVCMNMTWRPDPASLECREPLPGELGEYVSIGCANETTLSYSFSCAWQLMLRPQQGNILFPSTTTQTSW